VGGQFYDDFQAHEGGHHQAQSLRALVEYAGAALREAVTDGGDWQPLWTLLYGIALTAPKPAAEDERGAVTDSYATAVTELEKTATLLSHPERSHLTHPKLPVSAALPTGSPLVARDAYGSRFLVAAAFGYEKGVPDHWYAWDIDACWMVSVVAAGTFATADEALAEWRAAVGTGADSELSKADPGLLAGLLGPGLESGPLADMLQGHEPREFFEELYRMRRRARALLEAADGELGQDKPKDVDQFGKPADVLKLFRDWYRTRHPDASTGIVATTEIIVDEWGPVSSPDEGSFYACSPFRVALAAHLISNAYGLDHARRAIRLLPEWTQWCIEQSGIPESLARPSIEAADRAVDALDKLVTEGLPDPTESTPFRHREPDALATVAH
jgi:hypothetical protein